MSIYGLTEYESDNGEDMLMMLERGGYNRTTASTLMNDSSSRSHAIFTIFLEQQKKAEPHSEGSDKME